MWEFWQKKLSRGWSECYLSFPPIRHGTEIEHQRDSNNSKSDDLYPTSSSGNRKKKISVPLFPPFLEQN